MLGADGVMMGTRFFAAVEALGPASVKARLVAASGDETLRTCKRCGDIIPAPPRPRIGSTAA
jgi:NAD(P)H-dependent flavin oxidoreductase YrpB (nitropropane dioxygenase family)